MACSQAYSPQQRFITFTVYSMENTGLKHRITTVIKSFKKKVSLMDVVQIITDYILPK